MSFLSYAQNAEDVLLHRVFGGQETGFYVDVGAYHPVIGSTTKAFYDRGWSGINIEPGSVFAELAAARPRDVNLRMAVLDRAGEVAFVEDESDRGTSHVCLDDSGGAAARMVPCDTLEAIVGAHSRGRPVDFIKVDAEGAEAAIVRSTDWRRLRPSVLLIEATLPWSSLLANQGWEPFLVEQGYVRAYFDGVNCFYIPEEAVPVLSRHFQVPVNVLDRVTSLDQEELRAALHSKRDEAAHLISDLDTQRSEAVRLRSELDALSAALRSKHDETARLTAERDVQHSETVRLASEREALRAALHDKQDEAAHLASERDALRAALRDKEDETALVTSERDGLGAALQGKQDELARLVSERDALGAVLQLQQHEVARAAEAMRELEARLAPPSPSTESAPVAVGPRRLSGRGLARQAALASYKLVRPVVRPVLWRLRGFMIGGLADQMRQLTERIEATTPRSGNGFGGAELRHLAVEMESALLTLAMERTPDTWPLADVVPPTPGPTEPGPTVPGPTSTASAAAVALGTQYRNGGRARRHVRHGVPGRLGRRLGAACPGLLRDRHTAGLGVHGYRCQFGHPYARSGGAGASGPSGRIRGGCGQFRNTIAKYPRSGAALRNHRAGASGTMGQ